MYLLVYVDDIILISSFDAAAGRLVSALSGDFAVKDLGALHYFLGLSRTWVLFTISLVWRFHVLLLG
jgi:hypothetical protein